MKRTRLLLLFAALIAMALAAPAAQAGTRCSDDPERCVKSTATLSRPVNRVVAGSASAPLLSPRTGPTAGSPAGPAASAAGAPAAGTAGALGVGNPATPQPPLARKVAAPAPKPSLKPQKSAQRNMPAPTPGMGMLLKLSTGSGGDVSSAQGRSSDATTGQSWVL